MSRNKMPIKDVCLGIYDGPHATPPDSDEGAVFLGISNITPDGHLDLSSIKHISVDDLPKWTKRVVPQAGDIVFSYEATKGERPDDYELFAKQIFGMTTAHKCPVCHTTLFPSKGSCVVCDVCGWKDDLLVLENGMMMTKANPLPLRESQLEHWMLTDKRTSTRARELAQKRDSITGDEYVKGMLRLFWELGTTSDISQAIEDTLDELHAWDALYENDG